MEMKNKYIAIRHLLMLPLSLLVNSCVGEFLPDKLDAFDKDATFSQTTYRPTLGRTTVFTDNFNAGNSTQPLTFTLLNVRHADGTPAPELTTAYPVKIWKEPYLGTEKSLEEIENKRTTEYMPLLQVRKHSGEVIMMAEATSSLVKIAPDEGYLFDVKAENSGGYKEFADLQLIPTREMEYEPNNMDAETGIVTEDYVHPLSVNNMFKVGNNQRLLTTNDVQVWFRRNRELPASPTTLTIRFLGQDMTPINPAKFAKTNWSGLLHGFNMQMTDEYVRYEVAYPIPLVNIISDYTDKTGEKQHLSFSFDRIVRNNTRLTASMSFDFAIYKEGNWEIDFVFTGGTPDFEDK